MRFFQKKLDFLENFGFFHFFEKLKIFEKNQNFGKNKIIKIL